jgi:hypothetical protein
LNAHSARAPLRPLTWQSAFRAGADRRKYAPVVADEAFVARQVRDTVLFVFGTRSPADAEWEQLVEYYRQAAASRRVQILVSTEGGSPNAKQRARLKESVNVVGVRVAIVTSSVLARAAGVAVHWFNPQLRVFAPNELERAFDYLELRDEYRQEVRAALAALRRELLERAAQQKYGPKR